MLVWVQFPDLILEVEAHVLAHTERAALFEWGFGQAADCAKVWRDAVQTRGSATTRAASTDAQLDHFEGDDERDQTREPRVRDRVLPERDRLGPEALEHSTHHGREHLVRIHAETLAFAETASAPPIRAAQGGRLNVSPSS